ncbi:MAG: TolC family protein [Cyclobacteriaceae bacterium]|nr:TolC family protein [Cyclobacteriaceae bacterium]
MRLKITTILVCLAASANAQVLTLDSVLRLVAARNPMLQEYDMRSKAQQAYTAGAKGWMAPMVGAGTFMTPYPGQNPEEASKGSLMITVEQNIPNPAKLAANERYFASRSAVEDQGKAKQFNLLRAEAKSAYYQWLVAERKRVVLKEGDQILDLMLKLARLRYPYNQGSLGSIYKTEGRQHEVRNMLLMTEGEIEEASARLKALMNLPANAALAIDTTLRIGFNHSLAEDTASLRMTRSDIRQIDKTIEVMRLNRELQQYQAKPEFRLRFDHMQPLGQGMPTQFTAMAMVSIPIAPWSSKMYKSEVRGMEYDIEAMRRGQESILLEARGMLAGMTAQLRRMEQQLENYRTRIIPALRKNHESLMVAYEENRESLSSVVDGWEAMNMARLEYTDKLNEFYQMLVRYEKEVEQ